MGAGVVLFAVSRRGIGWSEGRIIRRLVVRGLILFGLQFVVENPAWLLGLLSGPIDMGTLPGGGGIVLIHFGVLYALGTSMIICALLVRLRAAFLAALGLGVLVAVEGYIPRPEDAAALYSPLVRALFIPGRTGFWQSYYPLFPWVGFSLVGMAFGMAVVRDRVRAVRGALAAALLLLVLFFLVRAAGGFGNLHPAGAGWIGFLNVTKYPPSISFASLTLGSNLLLLYLMDRIGRGLVRSGGLFLTYGRTALFFYIVHLYLYGVLGFAYPRGTGTAWIYPMWLLGLALLYPLCRLYGRLKRNTAPGSPWRLF